MWNTYAKEMGISLKDGKALYYFVNIGLTTFFVGDAAGRIEGHATGRAKDFADTDRYVYLNHGLIRRKFAMNLKIPFHTPEEYFLGDPPAKFAMGQFNPLDYIPTSTQQEPQAKKNAVTVDSQPLTIPLINPPSKPDVILFVGSPAGGKSTFYLENLHPIGYARVNQDTLKTRDRCVAEATNLLTQDTPIAIGFSLNQRISRIDNTNPEKATRKIWVDLARTFNRDIRCIHFTTSSQLARHNNLVRAFGRKAKVRIPTSSTNFRRTENFFPWRRFIPLHRNTKNRLSTRGFQIS